ncbi:MAG TPA: MOSC N-terminal beta barrel domain-containing protein [Solirubrobacteraceae bacterium]|nr:MOSC N-terminal beta barrel domain-containing protein [Solirubrobacteraceae bacterium]
MTVAVTGLAIAPLKGARLCAVPELRLERSGPVGDRRFLVVDHDDVLLETTRTPALTQVEPAWDAARGVLRLRFPGGREVEDRVDPGAATRTRSYDGRELPGRRVEGPLADALSAHLGRSVRLLVRDDGVTGADDFPVTLMSGGSLRALAPALGGAVPDARRFRMTIAIDGVEPWAEHGWAGRDVGVGEAVLHVAHPVPRCVVTTRSPLDGRRDVPVLEALAALRGKRDVTFGVWCHVVAPGSVRVGDGVRAGVAGSA